MRTRAVSLIQFAVLLAVAALSGCGSGVSPQNLAPERLEDLPGVASAVSGSVGDDDLPWGEPAIYVGVEMTEGATAEQVAAVLEELEDVELETAEVTIRGPEVATLIVGTSDLEDADRLARDLVAASQDPAVCAYTRDPSSTDITYCDETR